MSPVLVRRAWILALAAVAVTLAVAVALLGCSKSSNNNPMNPGGGGFSLGPLALNQTVSQTFTTGEVDIGYHCIPHQGSGMTGTVRVRSTFTGADPTVEVGTGNALKFFPDTITVKTGGTVHWHNASAMTNHTVTQN